ncbi:MAG: hypothetical protein ACRD8U_00225, partial [Pyrinomonadaceae bacterium]
MINPTQAFLIFVILSGLFGIFIGLNDRRNQGSLLTSKPFLRGCSMVAWGCTVLALSLRGSLRAWIALTSIGVLTVIQEYAIMAIVRFREQRTRPNDLMAKQPLPEVKEEQTWQQVRKKGMARFVIVNTALYAFSGVLLTSLAVLL